MSYLQCLAPKERIGLAFGSYGWSGQSVPMLHKMLGDDSGCGFKMLEPVKFNLFQMMRFLIKSERI